MSSEPTPTQEIITDEDSGFTRRGFVKVAIGGVCAAYGVAIGYPVYRYLNSPVEKAAAASAVKEVKLPNAEELPKGSALMFKFGTAPALLIHHEDDTWVAMSAVCTHLGCTVEFQPAQNRIFCACHGGIYDAKTGAVTGGPPPKGLTVYNVQPVEGGMTITRS